MGVREKLDKIKKIEDEGAKIVATAKADSSRSITKAQEAAAKQRHAAKEEATSRVDQARSLVEKDIQEQIGEIKTINEKKVKKLRREAAGNVSAAALEIAKRIKQGMAG